jgi:phenylacetate-CoA ligase
MEKPLVRKLFSILKYAKESVPYYKEGLQEFPVKFPVKIDNIESYFQTLPLLSRSTVQDNRYKLCADLNQLLKWKRVSTSGSTAEPLELFLDSTFLAAEATLFTLHVDSCLNSDQWREGKVFYLTSHATASSSTNPALWSEQGQTIKWNLVRLWQLEDDDFFRRLTCMNGSVITAMPSLMEVLCHRRLASSTSPIEITPTLVVLSGEPICLAVKRLIETTFHCPVTSLYTMAEAGIAGSEVEYLPEDEHPVYQVEEHSVLLEIVDADGHPLPPGKEGEIVITTLNNRAMPLIRYRTGDKGFWVNMEWPAPTFKLVSTRQPQYLRSSAGVAVNIVRFAKLFQALNLKQYRLNQADDGSITVFYSASTALDRCSAALIQSTLWGALGPDISIRLHRVASSQALQSTSHTLQGNALDPSMERPFADIDTAAGLTVWLRKALSALSNVQCAVLTGSCIDTTAATRFSDIDFVVFGSWQSSCDPYLLEVARALKAHIPKLAVNFECLDGLNRRSPLLTCRLLCEQIPVIGTLDESLLPWPSLGDLRLQGTHWLQSTIAMLWSSLVTLDRCDLDPIQNAWVTTKLIINGLRYRYLLLGAHETSSRFILTQARRDSDLPKDWVEDLCEAVCVAREHQPPPLNSLKVSEEYYHRALLFLEFLQDRVTTPH